SPFFFTDTAKLDIYTLSLHDALPICIIHEVEKEAIVYNKNLTPQPHSPSFLSDAICYNACEMAKDVKANALIGMTQSGRTGFMRSEEHTSELQSRENLVCRLLLEKKK